MKAVKKEALKMKTRAYYRELTFTGDSSVKGNVVRGVAFGNCFCQDGVVQNVPEWLPVFRPDDAQYKSSITNILEFGTLKLYDDTDGVFDDIGYIVTATGNFFLFVKSLSVFYTVATQVGKMCPFAVMGKSGTFVALCTEGKLLYVAMNGVSETVVETDVLPAGALFKHRVFVAMKGGFLKCSAPENFKEFDPAQGGGLIGFPNMGGEIVAMKAYGDALYLFFENGIMRLEVRGDASDFYAEKLDYTGEKIYSRTVCVCENGLYFMTKDGVYRVQGRKAERLDFFVGVSAFETDLEGCSVFKGRPIFQYQDNENVKKIAWLNKDEKSMTFLHEIMGVAVGGNGEALVLDKKRTLWRLSDKGNIWYSGAFTAADTDFGFAGRKTLRKIRLEGTGSVTLTLTNGKRSWVRAFDLSNGFAEAELSERGERFGLSFALDRESTLVKMRVEFETVT
ncbi:MAG: hypothetical protein IJ284_00845 [Clostridia bacterium]|nr:hypothetical protein [Clostridia bacterium]